MSKRNCLIMLTILFILDLSSLRILASPSINLPPQIPDKIKNLQLPDVRGKRKNSRYGCDTAEYLDSLYNLSTNIFIARVIESLPTDILETSRSKSNKMFLHMWVKTGWKKPLMRKQDLEINYDRMKCWRNEQIKIKANSKYLLYLQGEQILDYVLVEDSTKE